MPRSLRILLTHRPGGAYGYISDGWQNAFASTGHTVVRWDGRPESWAAFQPDLYMGCSGHRQPIPPTHERGRCRIAIHVNPYGPTNIPGINEAPAAIQWVLDQYPDAVFGYGHESDWRLWSSWIDNSIPWVAMATAADATLYNRSGTSKSLELAYVGGRWPYKATTLDSYLLPVLYSGKYTYKLYGWGDWPADLAVGPIADDQVGVLLSSAKVGPCISEPHTHQFGIDLPERIFKVALSGTLVIHDPVPGLHRYVPSAVMARTPAEFADLCEYYCKRAPESELTRLAQQQRREVLQEHTYHSRLVGLLHTLEFHEAAAGMQNYIGHIT